MRLWLSSSHVTYMVPNLISVSTFANRSTWKQMKYFSALDVAWVIVAYWSLQYYSLLRPRDADYPPPTNKWRFTTLSRKWHNSRIKVWQQVTAYWNGITFSLPPSSTPSIDNWAAVVRWGYCSSRHYYALALCFAHSHVLDPLSLWNNYPFFLF